MGIFMRRRKFKRGDLVRVVGDSVEIPAHMQDKMGVIAGITWSGQYIVFLSGNKGDRLRHEVFQANVVRAKIESKDSALVGTLVRYLEVDDAAQNDN